jgi:hypothetical protein
MPRSNKKNIGTCILENTPPPRGGYQLMSFRGKNIKLKRECEKGRKGKEKEKMGDKRVK